MINFLTKHHLLYLHVLDNTKEKYFNIRLTILNICTCINYMALQSKGINDYN